MTAAYYAMAKSVRYKTGYAWKEFIHSFRSNFRQTVPLSVCYLLAMVILLVDIYYVWMNDSKLNSAVFIILIFILFLIAGIAAYACPLLSRFDKTNPELLKMTAVVMFRYLPFTLLILLVFAAGLVGIYLMPWAILVIPGIYIYLLTFPMEWVLRKLMPKPEEGSAEAEKWYYQ